MRETESKVKRFNSKSGIFMGIITINAKLAVLSEN